MLGNQEMSVRHRSDFPSPESVIYLFGDVAVAIGTVSLPDGIPQTHRTTNASSMLGAQGSVEGWCSYFDSGDKVFHAGEACQDDLELRLLYQAR